MHLCVTLPIALILSKFEARYPCTILLHVQKKFRFIFSPADGYWLWFGLNNLPQFITDVCFAEVRSWQQKQHCFQFSVIFSLTQHNKRNATVLTKSMAHESTVSRKNPQEICYNQGKNIQFTFNVEKYGGSCAVALMLFVIKVTAVLKHSISFPE